MLGSRRSSEADVSRWLADAESITVLTGAGLSTESGIPDFRGPNGLWTRDPAAARLFDFRTYVEDPGVRQEAWQRRLHHPAWDARPNAGHKALVDIERTGRLNVIVTQNIDGLHQAAGSDPARVLEIHGTIHQTECLGCGARAPMRQALQRVAEGEADPPCRRCGGVLKSATVSFGQPLDTAVYNAAAVAARRCDVFLTAGTSLQVNPAAALCAVALNADAKLVVLNAEPTPYDEMASAVLTESLGVLLPRLVAGLAA